jgi:uncharacterized protein (TIGR02466 family)
MQQPHRQTELIFPTPIHLVQFTNLGFCTRAKNAIYNLDRKERLSSDELHWCTPDDLHLRQEFIELKNVIMSEVSLYLDNLGVIRDGEKMTCMWANVSKSKNRHAVHIHPNSFLSGVLYLNAPSVAGNIGFKDPRPGAEIFAFDYKDDSIFKHRTREVVPKEGLLILFPSWLGHGTTRGNFDDSEDRISLSFNILPTGNFTDYSRRISL